MALELKQLDGYIDTNVEKNLKPNSPKVVTHTTDAILHGNI